MSVEVNGNGAAAPAVSSDTEIRMCRGAVLVGATQIEVVLPADIAIGSLMFDLIKVLGDTLYAQGKDVSMFRTRQAPGRWTLGHVGAPPMPADKTLSELGIEDGDRLVMQRALSSEEYQPLVDDVTDATAMISNSRFKAWDPSMSRRVGAAIAVTGCVAVAVLIGLYSMSERAVWAAPAAALAVAAVAVLGAWVAGGRFANPIVSTALVLCAYPLAGVGAAAIVPGGWGAYHVVLCAGTLLTLAVVSAAVLARAVTLAAAVLTIGVLVLGAGLVRGVWSVPYVALGTGLTLAAVIALFAAPKLALMTARVPLPPVPTLGMAFNEPDRSPRFIVAGASHAQQYKAPAAEVFQQRTEAANRYLRGITIGAALCAIAGTALSAQPGHRRYWMAFGFVLLVAVVILRRARIGADRINSAVLLGTGAVIVAAVMVRLALFDGRLWVVLLVAAGRLLGGGAALVAGVVLPGMAFNPVQSRLGELLEVFIIGVLPFLAVWIMDIYGALRGLR
ncbi:type VII secretion integral membrane protein EccD [Mycobacterium hubeiense]|uniref:type VII secretion integral membrane protein EccD n=1 Tax=Mycobacterium hubeiense TaxID=1867256 RepID=UPI000C7F1E09|nr:type VII secretion integral membrane protein EccD [Mycobacterium sp. QGD 101]